ncbi:MAG: ABC transporter permease [Bauldia sp.]|nr:ABC transporter permease [Bauldia sp.]
MSLAATSPAPRRISAGAFFSHPVVLPVIAVGAALLFGLLLIVALGTPLSAAIEAFIRGAFGNSYSVAVSLNRAVVLALVGLGFIIANRANLTNVGGEGQIAVGGIAATALALNSVVAGLPLGLAFIVPIIGAVMAGAAWGGIAGVLKARVGTNEVISTLLLSFIAVWLVYWSVQSVNLLRRPMTSTATLPESLRIPAETRLPYVSDNPAFPLTIGIIIVSVLAVIVAIVLARSVYGFRLRAVGLNAVAAARAGIRDGRIAISALAVAGGFGGLAGAMMLLGEQHVLKNGFSSGYGFDGLVVGLLARGSVVGVIAGALLFGFLRSAGITMEMLAGIPSALVDIVQGVIVLSIAGAAFLLDRRRTSR